MPENEGTVITLDVPMRDGKEGYTGTMFSLFLRFGSILADPNFKDTDGRVYFMTRLMLSMLPNDDGGKIEMIKKLKLDIKEQTKGLPAMDDRNRLRNEICLDVLSDVFDVTDRHIGLSRKNRLGFIA